MTSSSWLNLLTFLSTRTLNSYHCYVLFPGSMSAMNKTKTVLGKFGANFVNAFVTTPMCCPSRSSILTGQYVHNHHVYSNVDHCGSNEWVNGPELQTFAKYLKDADYRTGKSPLCLFCLTNLRIRSRTFLDKIKPNGNQL